MDSEMSFKEAINIARNIIRRFEKIEGKPWGAEGAMIELSKQIGDLASLVMVQEKYYFQNRESENNKYAASREKIGDELADIFFSLIRLADHYKIDLLDSHITAREEENQFLKSRGV